MSFPSRRRLFVALFAVMLVLGAVGPVVVTSEIASASTGGVAGATSGADAAPFAATTPTDNESTQHENPDEAGEDGNLGSVKGWLLGRMAGRLEGSLINISQGQYDAAEGLLGEETEDFLGQYVDVAGDTESEEDDETAETVNDTIEEQRNFTQSRRNFSELYQEYLEAIENGNLERARRLARELADLERRLNRTGRNLTRNYRQIDNSTGINTGEERQIINRTVRNVSEIQEEIREDLFNETQIVINEYTDNASILDPIVVRGQVVVKNGTANTTTTANETPVPVGDIILNRIGARVTVNETGHFTLRHRPVLLPRGGTTLGLEYRPPERSGYLSSTAEFTTMIEGRESTLEINGTPEAVKFGDRIGIKVQLTVGNRSIAGVPIDATLGGEPLGSAVSANGTTTLSGVVPAAADDGQRELRVVLPFSGRALMTANATRTVRVDETDTRLSINATGVSATTVRVQGQLETVNGTPVPGQSVRIDIAGVDAGSVRTDGVGGFDESIRIPDGINVSNFTDRRVPVNATFSAGETNLAPSNASDTVILPETPAPNGSEGTPPSGREGTPPDDSDESGLFGLGIPWWGWFGALVVVVLVAARVYLGRGRLLNRDDTVGDEVPATSASGPESTSGADESDQNKSPSLLAIAMERLEAGASDTAMETSYEAVRQHLEERLGVAAGTHWELYRACQDAGWPEDRVTAVRRLTEAYEQAAFAPESLPGDRAREAIATARDLLEEGDTASGSD